MIFEYCGYQYGYDRENGYSVIPNKQIDRPTTFYKYYALNENSVDALTNMYVYATHPNQFNDPFDCNENLVKFDTWEDVQDLLSMSKPQDIFYRLEDALDFCQKAYKTILYKKLGLVSLTSQCDNYQMWALYTGNNGFCIEFDVNQFAFQHFGPFPMNYTPEIPYKVPISKYGGHIAMLIQSNIKNEWWSYENEWRLYIPNPIGQDMKHYGNIGDMSIFNFGDEHNRMFYYPIEAIKSITLGPKFFDNLSPIEVSPNEIDLSCAPKTNTLEFLVLNFLRNITVKFPITIKYAILSSFNNYEFVPIQIVKHTETKFRIIIV